MREHQLVELREKEEVVGVIRRSLKAETGRIIFVLAWLLLPFFFFFPLIRLGGFGFIVFIALLVSGGLHALNRRLKWRYTMLLITDERIFDLEQTGFFSREVAELDWDDVSEVDFAQDTIWQRMLNLGSIRLRTIRSHEFDLEISGVSHPERVRDFLVEVQCLIEPISEAHAQNKE